MEKRERERKKTRVSVRFGAGQTDRLGLITDVSARGLYITTNSVLPNGSAVRVQVPVPGGDPVVLDGKVMRSRRVAAQLVMLTKGGMGVRLDNVPPEWRASQSLPEEP